MVKQIDSANYETCAELKEIRKENRYDYEDQVCCQKDASGYEDMVNGLTLLLLCSLNLGIHRLNV